jgi:hypothetical protein
MGSFGPWTWHSAQTHCPPEQTQPVQITVTAAATPATDISPNAIATFIHLFFMPMPPLLLINAVVRSYPLRQGQAPIALKTGLFKWLLQETVNYDRKILRVRIGEQHVLDNN